MSSNLFTNAEDGVSSGLGKLNKSATLPVSLNF